MLILQPIAHETIWGGRTLQKYFSEHHDKIGHMYSLFDDSNCSNVVLNTGGGRENSMTASSKTGTGSGLTALNIFRSCLRLSRHPIT